MSPSVKTPQRHPARLLNVTVEVPPAGAPVTLAEAKEHLRVDGTDQDPVITSLIDAATSWAEGVTRRAFITRRLKVRFASFVPVGCDLILPFPVVQSPLVAIAYRDGSADLVLDVGTDVVLEPLFGIVREADGFSWPQGIEFADFIYDAGYGDAADVPEQIKTAIKVATAQMYEYRVDQTVGAQISRPHDKASEALLQDFRVFEL